MSRSPVRLWEAAPEMFAYFLEAAILGIIHMTSVAVVFISTHHILFKALLVGFLGSAAYVTALNYKFVGLNDKNRSVVIAPFCKEAGKIGFLRSFWYCMVGGFIAVIFQYDVPNFVAVQCLILGITWPAIVSQFLSGRMVEASREEIDSLSKPASFVGDHWRERFDALRREVKGKID